MDKIFLMAAFLTANGEVKSDAGKATVYWPGDGHCGTRKADGSKFKKTDHHIAHRKIPLNTEGIICNLRTKKCISTVVKDRGPFGAIRKCKKGLPTPHAVAGKVFKARRITWNGRCHYWQSQPYYLQKGFEYRGKFDLTKPVANAIKHRPFDKVVFVYKEMKHIN